MFASSSTTRMRGWRSAVRGVVTTTCSRSCRMSAASSRGAWPAAATCASVVGSENEKVLPLPDLALHPDAAAVVLDDLLADGQAQARALRLVGEGVAHLLEALEDLGLIGRSDAHSRCRTRSTTISPPRRSARQVIVPASVNFTAFEIRLITTWIRRSGSPVTLGRSAADPLLEVQALRLEERRGGGRGAIDDLAHVDGLHVPLELARLDLRQVEHVVDQLGEPLALAHHHLQVVFDLLDGLRRSSGRPSAPAGRCGPRGAS